MAAVNYYNDNDPFVCEWLRLLIANGLLPAGDVDNRSITDVEPADLDGYDQCHFFAGVGGWPVALGLVGADAAAGIWTGSCPCQPFSVAGKRQGTADERHLWPAFFRLIRECRPATVFGEQVASGAALEWLDRVFADLEGSGYACGAADLPAAGVGAPHIRQRLFWGAVNVADSNYCGSAWQRSGGRSIRPQNRAHAANGGPPDPLGNSSSAGPQERIVPGLVLQPAAERSPWQAFELAGCADDKARRVSAERGDEPLAYGIPVNARPIISRLVELGIDSKTARRIVALARRNRVGRLRGYGNAIVPLAAAEFVRAFLDDQGA